MIAGGGKLDGSGILEKFVELAGGEKAEIVVIPTASTDMSIAMPESEQQLRRMFLDLGCVDQALPGGFQMVFLVGTRIGSVTFLKQELQIVEAFGTGLGLLLKLVVLLLC